jgi:uncharacterized protein (TIGR03118 family)
MQVTKLLQRGMIWVSFGFVPLAAYSSCGHAAPYMQTDLVSNIAGLATITDPNLVNPWGVAFSPTGPFWVSDQGTNVSTLYRDTTTGPTQVSLIVSTPTTSTGPQGPTGQVNNTTSSFLVGASPANFIFANLNGTISAWNSGLGTSAQVVATTAGAVYTGLAIDPTTSRIYAADNAHGRIDVFNGAFQPVSLGATAFVDPSLPAGLVPFNVQTINGSIYVTYAPAGRVAQTTAAAGTGAVAVFSTSGAFVSQLISGSALASPWGVALAPTSFGLFGGDLLVGNFSYADSDINAFDPTTGAYVGSIPIALGGQSAGGLWALDFGNGGSAGSSNTLYVTDGVNGETGGLFAAITPVPEPSTFVLFGTALIFAAFGHRSIVAGEFVQFIFGRSARRNQNLK